MIDIAILRVIWWFLMGFLFIGFAITDGFDFGVAMLMSRVAKNEAEKNIVLDSILPVWEGNQVWIILGAGAVFAAWPYVYAVAFSSVYLPILLLLLTMGIARPVSFKYRSKLTNLGWRNTWDKVIFLGGFMPAFIFGILMGNILQGLPFVFDESLRITYTGSVLSLINPFAIWCGIASVAMLCMHGGIYIAIKTENPIADRARKYVLYSSLLLILLFTGGGIWITESIIGFQVIHGAEPSGYSTPLLKEVIPVSGAWMKNYLHFPYAICVPLLAFLGMMGVIFSIRFRYDRSAFIYSSLSIIGIIGTVGVSMFPFILPSAQIQILVY